MIKKKTLIWTFSVLLFCVYMVERGQSQGTQPPYTTGFAELNKTQVLISDTAAGMFQGKGMWADSATMLERIPIWMNFRGSWTQQTYNINDVVVDGCWTMVADTMTSDRPSPQPIGEPRWYSHGDAPAWSTVSPVVSEVISGQRYTWPSVAGYLTKIRLWIPSIAAGVTYQSIIIIDPDGPDPQVTFGTETEVGATGWFELPTNTTLLPPDFVFEVLVVTRDRSTSNIFAWDWNYTNPQNESLDPATGTIVHPTQNQSRFKVHHFDNGAVDRTADLATVGVGDQITGASQIWTVTNVQNFATYDEFAVIPAVQGSSTGVQTFSFEVFGSQAIDYVNIANFFTGDTIAQGALSTTGSSNIILDADAYGVDIEVQDVVISDEWSFLSYNCSSGTASGGGGGGADGNGIFDVANDDASVGITGMTVPATWQWELGNGPFIQFNNQNSSAALRLNRTDGGTNGGLRIASSGVGNVDLRYTSSASFQVRLDGNTRLNILAGYNANQLTLNSDGSVRHNAYSVGSFIDNAPVYLAGYDSGGELVQVELSTLDSNGIYGGSGAVPNDAVATIPSTTNPFTFLNAGFGQINLSGNGSISNIGFSNQGLALTGSTQITLNPNSGAVNISGGAGLTISSTATPFVTRATAGVDGEVLTSEGPAQAPRWQALPAAAAANSIAPAEIESTLVDFELPEITEIGQIFFVENFNTQVGGASDEIDVTPFSGESINKLAADAAFILDGDVGALFIAMTTSRWRVLE